MSSRSGVSTSDEQQGYAGLELMEELLDKLKLLNYEEDFIRGLKMRPLNRHYFALSSNPGEQFFMFTSLMGWLFRSLGRSFAQPQEDDDPNATIVEILQALTQLGIPSDFPISRLKKGSGWFILQILDSLSDKVMEKKGIVYKKPVIKEVSEDLMKGEEDTLVIGDEMADVEIEGEEEDDTDGQSDEDNILNVDDLYIATSAYANDAGKPEEILESSTTADDWNLELERVLPSLKVLIKSGNGGDWRSHYTAMKKEHSGLAEYSEEVVQRLERTTAQLATSLEAIATREQLINKKLDPLLEEYRSLRDELALVNEQYKEVNGGVLERQRELEELDRSLEDVRLQTEHRAATMADGSPLVQIKKALKDIKKETRSMDMNIAVAEHVILQTKLRDKSALSSQGSDSHITPIVRSSGIV